MKSFVAKLHSLLLIALSVALFVTKAAAQGGADPAILSTGRR
jgi:hypothetical protein